MKLTVTSAYWYGAEVDMCFWDVLGSCLCSCLSYFPFPSPPLPCLPSDLNMVLCSYWSTLHMYHELLRWGWWCPISLMVCVYVLLQ